MGVVGGSGVWRMVSIIAVLNVFSKTRDAELCERTCVFLEQSVLTLGLVELAEEQNR